MAQTTVGQLCLRFQSRELLLVAGSYIIGRSNSCDLVIDRSSISRRHARLDVGGVEATVADLNSRNGVYVNGERLGAAPVVLHDQDVFSVGGEQVEVRVGSMVLGRRSGGSSFDEDTQEKPVVRLTAAAKVDESEAPPTLVNNALDVVGNVAERMVATGHSQNAEGILRGHLIAVRENLAQKRKVDASIQERALDLSLLLATVLHKGEWFDYAVELLCLRETAPGVASCAKLTAALPSVNRVDVSKIRRLATSLRSGGPDLDRLRSAQLMDQLIDRALGGQR